MLGVLGRSIFVPSAGHNPSGAHHADILAQMGPMPDEADWKAKGLDKYGLIAVNAAGEAAQVEKVSYDTATRLPAELGQLAAVGPSLGSFSLGAEMLSSPHDRVRAGARGQDREDGQRPALLDADDAREEGVRLGHGHEGRDGGDGGGALGGPHGGVQGQGLLAPHPDRGSSARSTSGRSATGGTTASSACTARTTPWRWRRPRRPPRFGST